MNIVPFVISIIILALAVFIKFPYGFYIFLKFIIFGTMVYSTYCCFNKKNKGLAWASIVVLIIYNPFIPLYLTREIWVVINVLTVILCVVLIIWENLNTKTDAESNSKSNEEHNATPLSDDVKKESEQEFRNRKETLPIAQSTEMQGKYDEETVSEKKEESLNIISLSETNIPEIKESNPQFPKVSIVFIIGIIGIILAYMLLFLDLAFNPSKDSNYNNASKTIDENIDKLLTADQAYTMGFDLYYGSNGFIKNYDEAFVYFFISAGQGNSDAENFLGVISQSKGKYKDAFSYFLSSANANSKYGILNLADCYFYGTGTSVDFQKALITYERALTFGINNAYIYQKLGYIKSNLGDFKGAEDDYTKAIELGMHDPEVYAIRGTQRGLLRDYDGAIEDASEAIKINPIYVSAYLLRACINLELKNYNIALEDLNKSIELDPNSEEAYDFRGQVKQAIGDFYGAINDYNIAIKLNPNKIDYYLASSQAKIEFGNLHSSALEDIKKAIHIDPNNSYAYSQRGIIKYKLNDFKAYFSDMNRAIELDSQNEDAQYELGKTYKEGVLVPKNIKKAAYHLAKAAQRNHNKAQFEVGMIYFYGENGKKDKEVAKELWNKSARDGNIDAMYYLGKYYYESYRAYKNAYEWFSKAAGKGDNRAQYMLGIMYYNGKGISKDVISAKYWLLEAANNNNSNAFYQLGALYFDEAEYDSALKWLLKASDINNPHAQYLLGYMYYQGKGVPKDINKAKILLEESKNQGYSPAQKLLESLNIN